jgi:hypothetical protein
MSMLSPSILNEMDMKKNKILFALLGYILLPYSKQVIFAQNNPDVGFFFYSEVVPCAILYGGQADGYQLGLGHSLKKGKYEVLFTYGVKKRTYELSDQVAPLLINGLPIVDKTTDASVFTPEKERIGGVPDNSLFELLEEAGIKHYTPRDGAYVTNYVTLEISRNHAIKNKWNFGWGFGGQLGLMNRNEVGGGLSDSVNYFGQPINTWIIFRISARYAYYGITNRVSLTRKISNHFSIGIAGGVHLIMGKGSTDTITPYVSILAKCRI